MRGHWREFEHTGDLGIEAEAPDEASLYACCGAALFGIIAGPGPYGADVFREIEVSAPDRELLLVRWLRELLYLYDAERWLFEGFDVSTGPAPQGRRLVAAVRGARFDPARHVLRTELKAVTYHQVSFRREAAGTWRARVVLDV